MARQYCGQLGKQDNCQVAVSLSAANDHASLPIAYRLYLPHEWVDDPDDRRAQAGVPDDVVFQTKPQIALDQLRAARAAGIDAELVLADAGYGNDTDFRDDVTQLGLAYAVGIQFTTSLWPPGWNRCRRSHGAGAVVRRPRSDAMRRISRFRLSNWRSTFPKRSGGRSLGVKGPTPSLPRGLPSYGFVRRTGGADRDGGTTGTTGRHAPAGGAAGQVTRYPARQRGGTIHSSAST